MNKIFLGFTILSTLLLFGSSIDMKAQAANDMKSDQRLTYNKEVTAPGLLNKQSRGGARAVITNATITAINGFTFTVTSGNGRTFTVNSDSNTGFRRKFWGNSDIKEIQVGDQVNIIGKWTDNSQTTITATLVRDLSIMKRFGVFIGNVTKITSSGWTMLTLNRGHQEVTLIPSAKFTNRKNQPITLTDVATGHRIRVRGLWDIKSNTITQVSAVKDYSLPVRNNTSAPTPF